MMLRLARTGAGKAGHVSAQFRSALVRAASAASVIWLASCLTLGAATDPRAQDADVLMGSWIVAWIIPTALLWSSFWIFAPSSGRALRAAVVLSVAWLLPSAAIVSAVSDGGPSDAEAWAYFLVLWLAPVALMWSLFWAVRPLHAAASGMSQRGRIGELRGLVVDLATRRP